MKEFIEALNKFAETAAGKFVIIGLTLIVAGAAFFITYRTFISTPTATQPASSTQKNTEVAAVNSAPTTAAASQEASLAAEQAERAFSLETGLEIFSKDILRDPFTPMLLETTPTTIAAEKEEDLKQLIFLGTTYDEEKVKAVVSYEGAVSSISPGDAVGPYLLISVDETSARFLYGDMPFTLQVGESYKP